MRKLFPLLAIAALALALAIAAPTRASGTKPAPDGPTLRALMLDLEAQMSAMSAALYRDDLPAVAKAAGIIADHPRVSTEERVRIQGVLKEDFGKFAAADHTTHGAAAKLAKAAEAKDIEGVLAGLDTLQRSCISCHQTFRPRLVTKEVRAAK